MREHKFKVWCEYVIDGKSFTEMATEDDWFVLAQTGKLMTFGPNGEIDPNPEKKYTKLIPLFCTGLKDKNGKEIYEGTVSQLVTKGDIKLSKFVYFYNEGLARFQKRRDDGEIYDCDKISEGGKIIIGNIHENPKLLEKKCQSKE